MHHFYRLATLNLMRGWKSPSIHFIVDELRQCKAKNLRSLESEIVTARFPFINVFQPHAR